MNFDSYTTPDAEALLRTAQSRRLPLGGNRRVLVTEAAGAAVFLGCAVPLAVLGPAIRAVTPAAVIVSMAAFLVAARVRFPVAAGWTRPTQVVFIPMLFMLPVRTVPLIVAACLVMDLLPQMSREGVTFTHVLTRCGDAIYALAPAGILLLTHDQRFAWSHWPVYAVAFVAQTLLDMASYMGRTWLAEGTLPSVQMQVGWCYLTDACLTSAGLLIADSASHRPFLLLLALPLIAVFGLFARERSERMDNTLALSTAYRGTALLLGDVIEDDDEYTGIHSRMVVDLALAVATRLRLDASIRRKVEFGALLHDVGKIRIPKEIIHKPGKLDDAEWALMREHTIYGEQMLRQVGGTLSSVGKVVRHSHERWDGGGYPDGLAGEQIPIEARIVCACDAFNAMTTDRPYRQAMPLDEAITELQRCSGSHFDPQVVYALLSELADHQPDGEPVSVAAPAPAI